MHAGLARHRIGEFVHRVDARPPYRHGKSYLKLHLSPDGDEAVTKEFNNLLVNFCQLTCAAFVEGATKRMEKQRALRRGQPLQPVAPQLDDRLPARAAVDRNAVAPSVSGGDAANVARPIARVLGQ